MSGAEGRIVAVVTCSREVAGGGVPVFFARTEQEREQVARLLAKILRGTIHDLQNGAYVIVRH